MCIVHNLYCGYSLSAYVIISIIMIDQNKTFRSEKSAQTGPGLQAPMRGTITYRSDKKLLEVWLDSERGGEFINSLIDFIA